MVAMEDFRSAIDVEPGFCLTLNLLGVEESYSLVLVSSVGRTMEAGRTAAAELTWSEGLEIRRRILIRFVLGASSATDSFSSKELPWFGFNILLWILLRFMLGAVS